KTSSGAYSSAASGAEEPLHISRDHFGCAAVDRLVEAANPLGRFEIEFHRVCARTACLKHEAGGGIDRAACADRKEKIAPAQRLGDALHVVRHFAEPDDVGPHIAQLIAAWACRVQGQIVMADVVAL